MRSVENSQQQSPEDLGHDTKNKQHNKSMQADSKAAFFDPAIINGQQLELVMALPNGNNMPNYAN